MVKTPRIVADPRVMMGKPLVDGTRIHCGIDPHTPRRGPLRGRYSDRRSASHARTGDRCPRISRGAGSQT